MHTSVSSVPNRLSVPLAVLAVGCTFLLIWGTEPNTTLAFLAVATLISGCWLLWRPAESPVLLFVFGFQWAQASTKTFHANWVGVEVGQLSTFAGDAYYASLLALLGLLAMAAGMRVGVGSYQPGFGETARAAARRYGPLAWFRLYVAAVVVAFAAQSFALSVVGLAQPLLALASLKWAFFWMLTFATFVQPRASRAWWFIAFGVEFLLGVGGYFSDFKTVFFFTLFGLIAAGVRLSLGRITALLSLAAVLLSLGIVWTAVKTDYRTYLSGGAAAQTVSVGYYDRVVKLAELIQALDEPALVTAGEDLLNRLSYIDYFGMVTVTVPRMIPHEGGSLWWDAVTRPFMPRVLFPDKTLIDDSERTSLYTGTRVSGAESGTSISIGYMGESYIDFGEVGMMVPVFTLGLLLGGIYRWMQTSPLSRGPLGMGLATAVIDNAAALESSITKTFGGLVVTMLVSWLILRFAAPRLFPWVLAPRAT